MWIMYFGWQWLLQWFILLHHTMPKCYFERICSLQLNLHIVLTSTTSHCVSHTTPASINPHTARYASPKNICVTPNIISMSQRKCRNIHWCHLRSPSCFGCLIDNPRHTPHHLTSCITGKYLYTFGMVQISPNNVWFTSLIFYMFINICHFTKKFQENTLIRTPTFD